MTMTTEGASKKPVSPQRQAIASTAFQASLTKVERQATATRAPAAKPGPAESSWLSSSAAWLAGVVQGDFNDNASTAQVITGSLISMIPGIDQLCDVRDLAANITHCVGKGRVDASDAANLALTAIGFVPVLGSAVKGALKVLLKAATENSGPALEAARTLMANPAVRAALQKLSDGFAGYRDQAMGLMTQALDELSAAGGKLGAFAEANRQALLSGTRDAFSEMKGVLDRFLVPPKAAPARPTLRQAPGHSPAKGVPSSTSNMLNMLREVFPVKILDKSYGKAFHINDLQELNRPGRSVAEKANLLLANMNHLDVDHVILGTGGDKGQLLAELQKRGKTEFALCRVTQPLKHGGVESTLVLVRGSARSVELPPNSVCIAHTHPNSGMVWLMPSIEDQMSTTAGRSYDAAKGKWENRANRSELIIHGKGNSYRYINFMGDSSFTDTETRKHIHRLFDTAPAASVPEILNKAHMQLASVEREIAFAREKIAKPGLSLADKNELRRKIFLGGQLKQALEEAVDYGQKKQARTGLR